MAMSAPGRAAPAAPSRAPQVEEIAKPAAPTGPELDEDNQGAEDLLETALEGDFQTDVAVHEARFSS